jgi:lysylphosphatidylglycerol synthetase-like protein (DUF2156 family)
MHDGSVLDAGRAAAYRCRVAARSGRTGLSEGDVSFIKAVAIIGGLVLLAWWLRRHIREHHQDKVQWWFATVMPRAKRWAVWIFGATMLLWAVVHATAPDEARDDLSRQLEELFKSALEPAEDAEAPSAEGK